MSIDKSLRTTGKLVRPRNVFTKVERIKLLKAEGKWDPAMSVFGIPKVKTIKIKRKAKSEKKESKAEAATGAAAAEGAPSAAGSKTAAAAGKEKAKK